MSLLPIFLKLDGRQCLLVGAGTVALDKIASLLKTGLKLRVVAPEARAEVQKLAAEGKLEWVQREFEPADLDGNFIVIAATNVPAVNAAVYRSAVARGIVCNSVDDIPNCDFFFGSVVSRGDLQIAISTAGESPALAQRLRREIDEQLPDDLGPWLAQLGEAAPRSARDAPARRGTPSAASRVGATPNLRLAGLRNAATRAQPCPRREQREYGTGITNADTPLSAPRREQRE